MNTKTIVRFEASRENTPMAMVEGKVAFPERSGNQPAIGETWEVEIAGQNPTGKVVFLHLIKKVELVEWTWNDGISSRSRQPACLVVTPSGVVYRFKGSDIPGVVKVVKTKYHKNGKWSNTDYFCVSPQGTRIHVWKQSWEEGVFWPEASWEEAVKTVQNSASQVDPASLEAVIREQWSKAAAKFDENRSALMAFAMMVEPPAETTEEAMLVAPTPTFQALPESNLVIKDDDENEVEKPVQQTEIVAETPNTVIISIDLLKRLLMGSSDMDAVWEATGLLPKS